MSNPDSDQKLQALQERSYSNQSHKNKPTDDDYEEHRTISRPSPYENHEEYEKMYWFNPKGIFLKNSRKNFKE